jgi:cell division protein FtsW
MQFDRTNNNPVARWWWTVDRLMMAALFALICIGAVMVTAASPSVAHRIGLEPFHFIKRQEFFLVLSVVTIFFISLLTPEQVRRMAVVGFLVSLVLMVLLPFLGAEVKGAKRWLTILGVSVQPSEFLKPCLAVVIAWIFSLKLRYAHFPAYRVAVGVYLVSVALLLIQPDLGMTITVTVMCGLQFFLAGLPMIWALGFAGAGMLGMVAAYHFFHHVRQRIDRFLDPDSGDNYQVEKSLEAFRSGGLLGRGPGEGQVKLVLPDSHTDFVFSVAGEEFGMIFCFLILLLFAFIVVRGLVRVWDEKDWFVLLAVTGLLAQFGIQAAINMGVAVNLLPAKGMTLPFLSYGGSSLLAIALGMGMMLALTRKRFGNK